MLQKLKENPRIILSALLIIAVFLPWFACDVEVSGSFASYFSSGEIGAMSGMETLSLSIWGYLLGFVTIAIVVLPFVEALKDVRKKLYLILPVLSLLLLILVFLSVMRYGASGETSAGDWSLSYSAGYKPLLGYWVMVIGNIAMFAVTAIKDFGINSKESLKENVQNIQNMNVNDLKNQMSSTMSEIGSGLSSMAERGNGLSSMAELGSSLSSMVTIECKNCGAKVRRGTKFCTSCGSAIVYDEPEKEVEKYICQSCGKAMKKGDKFCSTCGGQVIRYSNKKICPSCGKEVGKNDPFCSGCGTKLSE